MAAIISQRYYWPGLHANVMEYVGECHECTLAKPPPRRARVSRRPTVGSYPFDLLFCDVVDMEKTGDWDEEKGTGYNKLVVFVDSLSRWVEAVPFHGAPSSEQVLDAFMVHIVSRYGAPRELRTDCGSNLASKLCQEIYKQTGVDLTVSSAEHHEALGTVERVQQTLIRMTRASDEGGLFWVDHLPFLLMSYRATPHRVTRMSPAELLYGRQFRTPCQMADDPLPIDPHAASDFPEHIRAYASKLHARLTLAWQSAREASEIEQEKTVREMSASAAPHHQYQVNDRVCRLLPGKTNKLLHKYGGPYRVAEVVSEGRYRLTDLENNMVRDTFDACDLRPYRTYVDAEELQSDEYLVDEILDHRDVRGRREFRIKWRGYARSKSTWEPKTEIMRRCAELVTDYEDSLSPAPAPSSEQPSPESPQATPARPRAPAPPPAPKPVQRDASAYESDLTPTLARFARGQWSYGRYEASKRGKRLRLFEASHFTPAELESPTFQALRKTAMEEQTITASAIIQWSMDSISAVSAAAA